MSPLPKGLMTPPCLTKSCRLPSLSLWLTTLYILSTSAEHLEWARHTCTLGKHQGARQTSQSFHFMKKKTENTWTIRYISNYIKSLKEKLTEGLHNSPAFISHIFRATRQVGHSGDIWHTVFLLEESGKPPSILPMRTPLVKNSVWKAKIYDT